MSSKRVKSILASENPSQSKKQKPFEANTLQKILQESGLTLKHPPEKCLTTQETVHIVRNIKKNLQKQFDYPRNVSELYSDIEKDCQNLDVFKHFLFPNIVRVCEESSEEHPIQDSVFKILLNIPILQNKLIDFLFEKAIDLAADSKCGPWIQMILKCISTLDCIVNGDKIATNLINLLDISTEKMVKLEIITAIPDIIGDQEHDNIAAEMSRILTEDHELIPAILECLTYLSLSNEQYEQLQKKTMAILASLSKCYYFPNFVKFVLMPGRVGDTIYLESVLGLRNALGWPTSLASLQDIATSQVLTASAIRNTMVSSKVIANSWFKVISSCKVSADHKPIDFVILLILYSTSEEKQKQVENLLRKQIKLNILKEDLLDEAFDKFMSIIKENLKNLIDLTNSLMKANADPIVEAFASHIYVLVLSKLEECCQTIVAELLQLALDSKQCVMSILNILNQVAVKDMSILKPQSLQMLTLMDRMDDMKLQEIRSVMNLICGLAYNYENSIIRDDIHMIIRKELSSSTPSIKIQGILAGVHAVKYLMATHHQEDNTIVPADDISYGSVTHLSEGDLREAAQIIELISRSTRQFPDLIAFFYDEMSNVMYSADYINKHFLSWLTDAVTNDLQQNFIVDGLENERCGDLRVSMQLCLNDDSEMDEVIAINIAQLVLQPKEINVSILSALFQLVQILHSKRYDGNLTSIDALLGCPIILPKYDIDTIEDIDQSTLCSILDCLIHCVNWLRELLNAFATQNDDDLKSKILQRVIQIAELETLIGKILFKSKITYKPPVWTLSIDKYSNNLIENKTKAHSSKQKCFKKTNTVEETLLPETIKSQATQNNVNIQKSKADGNLSLPFRSLSLNILYLFKNDFSDDDDPKNGLTIKTFNFLIKSVNENISNILISKIKRKTFLSKAVTNDIYDPKKAEECAKSINEILTNIVNHTKFITSYIESHTDRTQDEGSENLYSSEFIEYVISLENIYHFCTTYFKWIGFRNHNIAMLKSSLRSVASINNENAAVSLKDLLLAVAKCLQKHTKYCLQMSTAIALIEFLMAVQEYSENSTILKIIRDVSQDFLSQQWKTLDGTIDKGVAFNQSLDKLSRIYLINNEISALKNITLQLNSDIQTLKSKNDCLTSFKSINKGNFPILYRNLGNALNEATKKQLNKRLTNNEHLDLWKDVAIILKYMSEIAKSLENRNNLSAFFKKTIPVLKLFLTQGMPILEIEFKGETEEVLEILKILQQSTRFLQSLCCHSRLKKDNVLMSKVPYIRQLLETLIYKVKAALAANNCSEAFWMGNLKNKNIHGEIIATQQTVGSEESVDDYDEQLPDDEDSDETDDEMINPESNSVSDIV